MFIYIYIRRERVLTISTRFFPSIFFFNRLQVIQVFSIGFIVISRKDIYTFYCRNKKTKKFLCTDSKKSASLRLFR
jgi:hypothetical protein